MTTARDICSRALRRLKVIDATEEASADDAALALGELNDMLHSWAASGVDVQHSDFALSDAFFIFVPPQPDTLNDTRAEGRLAKALAEISDRGAWDADTNTPTLATGAGTVGDLYRVSVAGSTTLDGVTAWAVNEYAIFDGVKWLKSQPSRPFEGGVTAMLAIRLADDFGVAPQAAMVSAAQSCWTALLNAFAIPAEPQFDRGMVWTPSRRFVDYY